MIIIVIIRIFINNFYSFHFHFLLVLGKGVFIKSFPTAFFIQFLDPSSFTPDVGLILFCTSTPFSSPSSGNDVIDEITDEVIENAGKDAYK